MDIVINAEITSVPEGTTLIPNQGNYYHNILACLDYPVDYPPVADLLRSYHGLDGQWLIASPIHWQATHNDAMIVASGHELQLSDDESRRWFAALVDFVASENIHLQYHDAHTWLIRRDTKPQILAKPVHVLQHQSMMPELKMLDETLFWQRFITENQMFFSAHAMNKTREGLYPINGLWIWGDGALRARTETSLVGYDDDLLHLAKLLSINVSHYPSLPSLSKNSVLLCNDLCPEQHQILQARLQKNTVRWYWNNHAYLSKPKNWLSRLMENIK